ncbi:variable large family protein (plasmid) [Borrelia hermsii]|nr:variable large family protein [Borrelia hermsii]
MKKMMTSVKEKLTFEVIKNGNYAKVKTVVDKFIKEVLDEIASEAKEGVKGAGGYVVIENAVKDQNSQPEDA